MTASRLADPSGISFALASFMFVVAVLLTVVLWYSIRSVARIGMKGDSSF